HVGGRVLAYRHPPRTREHWHDRAHERDETREYDGPRSALVEELLRALEVLGLEQPGVRLEQARAVAMTERVTELRAGDRRDERAHHHHCEVEVRVAGLARRAEGAGQ